MESKYSGLNSELQQIKYSISKIGGDLQELGKKDQIIDSKYSGLKTELQQTKESVLIQEETCKTWKMHLESGHLAPFVFWLMGTVQKDTPDMKDI